MKTFLRRLLSLALAAAFAASALPVFASEALGHDLLIGSTPLHEGVELANGVFWSDTYSDFRRENYVVYTPNAEVSPLVTFGAATLERVSVPDAARALEAQGLRVVAGINGDFYGVSSGVPLGPTMSDGVLGNAAEGSYAIGFRADGSAILGAPQLRLHTTVNGGEGPDLAAFNHIRYSYAGIYLYNSAFNTRGTTGTNEPGVDVICSAAGGALAIGGTLTLRVEEVLSGAVDAAVEEGKYILTANLLAGDTYTAPLLALQPGDEVAVTVEAASEEWNGVQNLIGALYQLVADGEVCEGLEAGAAPRTAIGQRADGSVVFYTIDGRQNGFSRGASLTQVAKRLVELGCVTALCLDGGGSTTMVATRPEQTASAVVNRPSDGAPRAVTNHVFLVAPNTPSGVPDHIYIAPSASVALPNAELTLTAAMIDTNHIPMESALAFSTRSGSVSEGGVWTLPQAAGTATVSASGGGRTGSAAVEVVSTPDTIALRRDGRAVSALTVLPGDRVELTAEATLRRLPLACANTSFTWEADEGAGSVDENGVLTAALRPGGGTLTVSAGGVSLTVPVSVSTKALRTLDGFEAAFEPVAGDGFTLSRVTDENRVRRGFASARLDYAVDGAPVRVPLSETLAPGYDCVNLWIYGDDGGGALALETDAGMTGAIPLSFPGWKLCTLALPAGASAVTGAVLSSEEPREGAVWLDQLVLSYGALVDEEAPQITLSRDGETDTLNGTAVDAVDGGALTTLSVAYDGEAIEFAHDPVTGAFAADLPAPDGHAHRVTVAAGDASGNLARESLEISINPALVEPAFSDAAGSGAEDAIDFIAQLGISNGDGAGRYLPGRKISRLEFAAMLYRYLEPEEDYSQVEAPFADFDKIPKWGRDAARAMYALGVVKGAAVGGEVYFQPTRKVSRQEAITMVGRLLEKGYAAPAPGFTDSASVAKYAKNYVSVLGGLGILPDCPDGSFHPAAPLTRAEAAVIFYRLS